MEQIDQNIIEKQKEELLEAIADCRYDPLLYSQIAYNWGHDDLSDTTGPREWQRDILGTISTHLQDEQTRHTPLRIAVASGHGIGKSALISMVSMWALSTCVDTKIVITANTENQLRTKTWPELLTWHRRAINSKWFDTTATSVSSIDEQHVRTWRADAIPWSVTNTEGFAGLHNKGKRIVVIYDEASSIDDLVWEVTEGALTDENTEIIWIAFGNPTRNTGRFRECFGKFKHRWVTKQIDSRTVEGTNKPQINQWIADYGEDSDFARVRIRGEFPRSGSMQFIGSDIVDAARTRDAEAYTDDPLVLGVDVARFGDDESILCPRRGKDARSIPWRTYKGVDTMTLAAEVAALHEQYQFDAIFVDGGGVGGGVVDRLVMLKLPVFEVQFGGTPSGAWPTTEGAISYNNKAAEMWGTMRDWLKRGGAIPDDPDLASQLVGREYGYQQKQGKDALALEKKTDMKRRGLSSPDKADALGLTFALPVAKSDHKIGRQKTSGKVQMHYDPLDRNYIQQDMTNIRK